MKNAMNQQRKPNGQMTVAHQGMLDLTTSDRWPRLSDADQQACRKALAQLLYQVVTAQPVDKDNER